MMARSFHKQFFFKRHVLPSLPRTLLVALVVCLCSPAAADLIQLTSGGEIRGRIQTASTRPAFSFKKNLSKKERAEQARAALKKRNEEKKDPQAANRLTIQTLSGSKIVVNKDDTDLVVKRREEYEIYERAAPLVEDTVQAHWEMAEWCRKKSLKDERRVHLERIVLLDPTHEKAHRGLDHVLENNEWRPREEVMREKGYVLYRGRWLTEAEVELKRKSAAQRDGELKWFKRIHQLYVWLNGTHDGRRNDAIQEFRTITDPHAIPGLKKHFSDEKNRDQRMFYVELLGQIESAEPVPALVIQSLHDVDQEVRRMALEKISPDYHKTASFDYIRALKHSENHVVRRAAGALQKVGDEDAVPSLINALSTTHKYRVVVEDQSVSFGSDGSYSMGGNGGQVPLPPSVVAALRTGQLPFGARVVNPPRQGRPKVVLVQQTHDNPEVLRALRDLTDQNFGYDKRAWNLWLLSTKTGG